MKRILMILLLAAAVPLTATAQKRSGSERGFQAFYDKYSGREHFTTIEVSGEILRLLNVDGAKKAKNGPAATTFDGIDKIRVVVSEKGSPDFVEEIKRLPGGDYKLLMTLVDSSQSTSFYFRKDMKYANRSEFLMIIYGETDNLALSITGEIDLKDISRLSDIGITGLDKFSGEVGKQ